MPMDKKWFVSGLLLTIVMVLFWIYIIPEIAKMLPKEILESRASIFIGGFLFMPLFLGVLMMLLAFVEEG